MTKRQVEVLIRLDRGWRPEMLRGFCNADKDRAVLERLSFDGLVLGMSINGRAMRWKITDKGRTALTAMDGVQRPPAAKETP